MSKTIKEWRAHLKKAEGMRDKPLDAITHESWQNTAETAKKAIEDYKKYKLLLKPKMIRFLKRWVKSDRGIDCFCLHGDQQNVFVTYNGRWTCNGKGEIIDHDYDGSDFPCCNKHNDLVVMASDVITDLKEITEFAEVVKILNNGEF